MNQSFTSTSVLRYRRYDELARHGISLSSITSILDAECKAIEDDKFSFSIKQVGRNFVVDNLAHQLILRKLYDNVKRLYKDEPANRRQLVKQVKVLLRESCPYWVLRTDIKSFFESIPRHRILDKLQNDSLLSYESKIVLKTLFNSTGIYESPGLPRGINISSILSEIYMRKFDRWGKQASGIYYYSRFVDDIIVFSSSKSAIKAFAETLDQSLDVYAPGLSINAKKTQSVDSTSISHSAVNYLGYSFSKKSNELRTGIALNKTKKIKTRITLAFVNYAKNRDFDLLVDRMKFLTSNYKIMRGLNHHILRAGIYYSYSEVDYFDDLKELDQYYRKVLFSHTGKLGVILTSLLNSDMRDSLNKYSFLAGHKHKIIYDFTVPRMAQITQCWHGKS